MIVWLAEAETQHEYENPMCRMIGIFKSVQSAIRAVENDIERSSLHSSPMVTSENSNGHTIHEWARGAEHSWSVYPKQLQE